ncbi:AMP-binding protein [Kocuria sp. M1R5S2]|uniref:AMP-binding protein n=1 Tax=Kocuria rhizosphaerae TaxID=3376285 RepID=UPI00379B9DC6
MDLPDDDLSYHFGETEPPLLRQTIPENLACTAERFPERDALVDLGSGLRWSWAAFHQDVRALATGLHRLGVRTGERIALWAPNTREWPLVQFAAAEIGAILVAVDPAHRPHELLHVLRESGAATVVVHPPIGAADLPGMLEQVRPRCPALRRVVVMGSPGWDALVSTTADEALLAGVRAGLDPEDPILLQYTAGTTGTARGATLSHRNVLNNGYLTGELLAYTERDRVCLPVPFHHCFGSVAGTLAATTHGACVVIPAPAFTAASTLAAVELESCTSLCGTPAMFEAELALAGDEQYDLSSLRTGLVTGSACPEATVRAVVERLHVAELSVCYGTTEASPVATQTRRDDPLERRAATVGRAGPHLEAKVVDPLTRRTVPLGTTGEFCTRGYSVMHGYWDDPRRTAQVVDHEGWLHTGDLAVMDREGYVRITGRIQDVVVRGGETVHPREVEDFLLTHPDVVETHVIGVPDATFGEEVVAWVRLRSSARPLTAEALRAYCEGQIARHKIPRHVHVADAFPLTATGTVRRAALRAESVRILDLAPPDPAP